MHNLKFILYSGEVVPGGSLAPVLAPFSLDLPKLSRELNDKTLSRFPKGFPVIVRLVIREGQGYEVRLCRPPVRFYLSFFRHGSGQLASIDLFNLVRLFSLESKRTLVQVSSMIFGNLSSFSSTLKIFISQK
jgi:hypothetical protein